MTTRFRLVGLTVLIGVLLLAAACSGVSLVPDESDAVPSRANDEKGKVTLEFWHTYSDLENAVFMEKVLPLFEKQHPDIVIHAVRKDPTDQLKNAVRATVADNKAPDVMRMDIIWVPEFAKLGILSDLSAMEGFGGIRGQFIGSLLETAQYQGRYYGLPVNANVRAAIFNKKLLREAGLAEPPRTFEEVYQAAKKLKKTHDDVYGIGICCSNGWGMLPYFWTFGGKLTDPDLTRASGYLDGEDSRAALRKLKRWYDEGIISPSVMGGQPGTWDGILKGKLLMIDDAHWFYTVNASGENKALLDDMAFGMLPDDVNRGTSVIGGENLVIFDKSRHKAEAWEFIRWMTTEVPQQLMAETGLIPTNKGSTVTGKNELIAGYQEQMAFANPRPPVPEWTEMEDVFARMVERILAGEQTVEEATGEAAAQIDVIMSR